MRRHLLIGMATLGLLALPFSLNPRALVAGGSVVAANDALCQSTTSCKAVEFKICPHVDGSDYLDWECVSGCRIDPD